MSRTPPYPFVKWAGGKTRLLPAVLSRLPQQINTYFEPLVGGGAVFITLAKRNQFKQAVLFDTNTELVNAWNTIKNRPLELIKALKKPKYRYDKQAFLKMRAADPEVMSQVERAARFIYLNRTCFNGLWRVNSSGKFNVPFGRYTNPMICDAPNIKALSTLLRNVSIINAEFGHMVESYYQSPGDAVYFDPPYIPMSATSKFTAYTEQGFSEDDHRQLAELFKTLGDSGVRVVLTNSAAKLTYELYDGFDMDLIEQNCCIGGPAAYRKTVSEIIIFHGPKTHP